MRPLRILVTGFEPFGGEPVNPSGEIVNGLRAARRSDPTATSDGPEPPPVELVTAVIPVDRERYQGALELLLERHEPEAVICIGQAKGRTLIDLETTAHNLIDFRGGRDNGGHSARGESLDADGPPSRTSSLPVAELARELAERGHRVAVSDDAARHLCNALYYAVLARGLAAVFVHVPLLPEQAARNGGAPSLELSAGIACVHDLVSALGQRLAQQA